MALHQYPIVSRCRQLLFLRSPDQPNPVIQDSSLPEEFANLAQSHRRYQITHLSLSASRKKEVRQSLCSRRACTPDGAEARSGAGSLEQYMRESSANANA